MSKLIPGKLYSFADRSGVVREWRDRVFMYVGVSSTDPATKVALLYEDRIVEVDNEIENFLEPAGGRNNED